MKKKANGRKTKIKYLESKENEDRNTEVNG